MALRVPWGEGDVCWSLLTSGSALALVPHPASGSNVSRCRAGNVRPGSALAHPNRNTVNKQVGCPPVTPPHRQSAASPYDFCWPLHNTTGCDIEPQVTCMWTASLELPRQQVGACSSDAHPSRQGQLTGASRGRYEFVPCAAGERTWENSPGDVSVPSEYMAIP